MLLRLLLLLSVLHLRLATAATLPGCDGSCGNITIPYPFGLTPGCYVNGFKLTCNDTYDPPKLFIGTTNIEVRDVTLDNVVMLGLIARDCYDEPLIHSYIWTNLKSSPYTFSNTRNKFTAVGCDTVALISNPLSGIAFSGCVSLCRSAESVINRTCSGIGCCQTAIPKGLKRFDAMLQNFGNHSRTWSFSPCSYAFLIDAEEYAFDMSDFYNFRQITRVPVVLDWAIGNRTCAQADEDGTLLCGARSKCLESANGPGYRCSCVDGYQGNPYLSDGCQDIDECEDPAKNRCADICTNTPGSYTCSCSGGSSGDGRKDGSGCRAPGSKEYPLVPIVLGCGLGLLLAILITSLSYWGLKKRRLRLLKDEFFKQNGGLLLQEQISSHEGAAEGARIFTSEELKKATDKYSSDRILGVGGSGTVYKGFLPDRRPVAIKKSKVIDKSQIEQFINEVVIVSKVIHRNVVKILGCCLETEVPLLVYEYVSNGTLFEHLHSRDRASSLSWEARLRIAAEAAGALAYLHSATARPIIHRDVKSANILLDENYMAKVSDFGASRLIPLGRAELTTLVLGTLGYLDPEYFHTGQLTEKSDVYSFGVVLVELLTGRVPVSRGRTEEEKMLSKYFISAMERNELFEILEPRVAREGERERLREIAGLALRCLRMTGEERPTMREVAEELERARLGRHPWAETEEESETGRLLGAPSSLTQSGSGTTSSNVEFITS